MNRLSLRSVVRPSARAQRGGAGVWLLALVVVGAIVFAVYWFVLRGGGGGGSELARVIPSSADTVASIDAGALLTSPDFAKLAQLRGVDIAAIKAKLAEAGIKPEDLKSVVVAADVPDAGAPELLVAARLDADTKAAKGAVEALRGLLPADVAERLDLSKVEAFEGGLVLAGSGALYDQAAQLARGQGQPSQLAPALAEVRDAIDASAHIWVAASLPKALTEGGLPGPAKQLFGDARATHGGFSMKLDGKVEIKAALRLEGGDAGAIADKIGAMLGFAGMGVGKEIGEVLKALDIGSKGQSLTLSVSLTAEQLESLAKSSPF